MTAKVKRICSQCGHEDDMEISKRDAYFEPYQTNLVSQSVCSCCSSTEFATMVLLPELDDELIIEWATNDDLCFNIQDEDLVLAHEQYLNVILHLIDSATVSEGKKFVLTEALCDIVYAHLNSNNPDANIEIANLVIRELTLRKETLDLSGNILNLIK